MYLPCKSKKNGRPLFLADMQKSRDCFSEEVETAMRNSNETRDETIWTFFRYQTFLYMHISVNSKYKAKRP